MLNSKEMLLKIYYERNEVEALYNLLAFFRNYLKRNKLISKNIRLPYQNFISLLTQTVKSEPPQRSVIKEKLKILNPLPPGIGYSRSINPQVLHLESINY